MEKENYFDHTKDKFFVISTLKELSHHGLLLYNIYVTNASVNPLSPHDAWKHHFTSLKTDLIFLQQRVLERKFP